MSGSARPPVTRQPFAERHAGLLLFLLSLAVKLTGVAVSVSLWGSVPVARDVVDTYRPLALSVLQGDGYVLAGDARDATRIPPAFPLYLAAVYRVFGPDVRPFILSIFNSVLRASTTLLVYLLASTLLDSRAAVAAGLIHALDPWEVLWAVIVLKDSVALVLFMGAVVAVSRIPRAAVIMDVITRSLNAGLLIALAGLARFASIALLPCALLWLNAGAFRDKSAWRRSVSAALAILTGGVVGLSPWMTRNRMILGEFTVSSHLPGRYFYVGNGPGIDTSLDITGYGPASTGYGTFIREVEIGSRGPTEADRLLFQRAVQHLLAHPGVAADLAIAKVVNMWRPTFRGASRLNWLVLGIPYIVLVGCAATGGWLAWQRKKPLAWVGVVFTCYMGLSICFYSEIRHRQFLTPLLALAAGEALAGRARR